MGLRAMPSADSTRRIGFCKRNWSNQTRTENLKNTAYVVAARPPCSSHRTRVAVRIEAIDNVFEDEPGLHKKPVPRYAVIFTDVNINRTLKAANTYRAVDGINKSNCEGSQERSQIITATTNTPANMDSVRLRVFLNSSR